jgi:hypothetical protein
MNHSETPTKGAEKASMPLRAYQDLLDEFPNAHLVVAMVRARAALQPGKQLLARLLEALKPKGHYALGVQPDGQHFAVHCVFQREDDAVKLGMAVWATRVDRYAGFASQRAFLLNQEGQETIKTVLAELDG